MKKSRKTRIPKKISKYILSKELNLIKTRWKSPSLPTSTDSQKSNNHKRMKKPRKSSSPRKAPKLFVPIINEEEGSFILQSNGDIPDEKFLSNLKQNKIFTMQFQKSNSPINTSLFNQTLKANSFVKIKSKITVTNNISSIKETNIHPSLFDKSELNKNTYKNLFENNIIDSEFFDTVFHSLTISRSNSISSKNHSKSSKNNSKSSKNSKFYKKNRSYNKKRKGSKDFRKDLINFEINNFNSSINLKGLTDKEKVIILSLMDLNKNNFRNKEDEIDIFNLDLEEYSFNKKYKNIVSSYSSEEDLDFEKNVYEFVDNRIKLYYKSFKNVKPHILDEKKNDIKKFNNEIKKILMYEQKVEALSCLGFKSIVMSLHSLIIDLLSNTNIEIRIKNKKEKEHILFNNDNNLIIFIALLAKYNKIKDICPYIENDFKEIIQNFENEKKMKISLSALFTDLYWDHVFKISSINKKFLKGYTLNNFKVNLSYEESKNAMKNIIDILIECDSPYKKNIGILLNLPYIRKKDIFLMNYIIKHKKNLAIIPPCNNNLIEKKEENSNNGKNKEKEESLDNAEKEEKEEDNNEKITENFSLEEVYNYIQGDDNNSEPKYKKKGKKRRKRKKNKIEEEEKNKENQNILINKNKIDSEDKQDDPVVEEFIQYFNNYNKTNVKCVKIKPVISKKWLESIP